MVPTTFFHRDGRPAERFALNAKGKPVTQVQNPCGRCGGAGGADKWKHTGWTCFQCGGNGKGAIRTVPLYTSEQIVKLNATAIKREAKKAATLAEKRAAEALVVEQRRRQFLTDNAELLSRLRRYADGSEFLTDVLTKAMLYASITDNQKAAVIAAMDRIDARDKANAASQHYGSVKQRVELLVTVTNVSSYARTNPACDWLTDTVYIVTMTDATGTVFVSKSPSFYAEKGAALKIKGTVKAHDEYRGCKQTVLQRVKIVADEALTG